MYQKDNLARKYEYPEAQVKPARHLHAVPQQEEVDEWDKFEDRDVDSYQEKFYQDVKAASAVYDRVVGKSAFEMAKDSDIVREAQKLQASGDHLAFYSFIAKNERALGFEFEQIYEKARNLFIKNERLNPEDPQVNDKIEILVHAYQTEKSRAEIQTQYDKKERAVTFNPLLNIGINPNGSAKVTLNNPLYMDSLRQSRFHQNPSALQMVHDMKAGLYNTSNILEATRASIQRRQPGMDSFAAHKAGVGRPTTQTQQVVGQRMKEIGGFDVPQQPESKPSLWSRATSAVKEKASSLWGKAKSLFGR